MARIDAFLKLGLAQGCSDIHLAVGVPPMLRMNGDLMPIKFRELSDTELETYILEILTAKQTDKLQQGHDLDFSYVADEGGRFRVNVFRKATGPGAVFRFGLDPVRSCNMGSSRLCRSSRRPSDSRPASHSAPLHRRCPGDLPGFAQPAWFRIAACR